MNPTPTAAHGCLVLAFISAIGAGCIALGLGSTGMLAIGVYVMSFPLFIVFFAALMARL